LWARALLPRGLDHSPCLDANSGETGCAAINLRHLFAAVEVSGQLFHEHSLQIPGKYVPFLRRVMKDAPHMKVENSLMISNQLSVALVKPFGESSSCTDTS
jgi:hypothetical protein